MIAEKTVSPPFNSSPDIAITVFLMEVSSILIYADDIVLVGFEPSQIDLILVALLVANLALFLSPGKGIPA